jgi:hypothetical protein
MTYADLKSAATTPRSAVRQGGRGITISDAAAAFGGPVIGFVCAVTVQDFSLCDDDRKLLADQYNRNFRSSAGRMQDGVVVDKISTRNALDAAAVYAVELAAKFDCPVLKIKMYY